MAAQDDLTVAHAARCGGSGACYAPWTLGPRCGVLADHATLPNKRAQQHWPLVWSQAGVLWEVLAVALMVSRYHLLGATLHPILPRFASSTPNRSLCFDGGGATATERRELAGVVAHAWTCELSKMLIRSSGPRAPAAWSD